MPESWVDVWVGVMGLLMWLWVIVVVVSSSRVVWPTVGSSRRSLLVILDWLMRIGVWGWGRVVGIVIGSWSGALSAVNVGRRRRLLVVGRRPRARVRIIRMTHESFYRKNVSRPSFSSFY